MDTKYGGGILITNDDGTPFIASDEDKITACEAIFDLVPIEGTPFCKLRLVEGSIKPL